MAEGVTERTIPETFAASETFDVGPDTNSPVANDYFDKALFKFNGTLKRLHFKNMQEEGSSRIKDKGKVTLHLRRGVVEYIPEPDDYYRKADYVLQLDSKTWAELYLSAIDLDKTVGSGIVKVTKGGPKEIAAVFDLFDGIAPTKNFKIPPLED